MEAPYAKPKYSVPKVYVFQWKALQVVAVISFKTGRSTALKIACEVQNGHLQPNSLCPAKQVHFEFSL